MTTFVEFDTLEVLTGLENVLYATGFHSVYVFIMLNPKNTKLGKRKS